MITGTKEKIKSPDMQSGMVKCPLCGYSFERGQKTSCQICPLNYGSCRFEKCPHCGYDVPQSSRIWTSMLSLIRKIKKAGKK